MKRELRDKWVAALRSGEYQQGHEWLHRGKQFCCLGVLCKVAGVPRDALGYMFPEASNPRNQRSERMIYGALLNAVNRPDYAHGDRAVALAEMNDGGASFEQIADWIERYVPVDPEGGQ